MLSTILNIPPVYVYKYPHYVRSPDSYMIASNKEDNLPSVLTKVSNSDCE